MNNYFGIGIDSQISYEFHIQLVRKTLRNLILGESVVTLLHYCMQLYVLMISFSEIKVCLLICICRFKNKAHYFQLSLQKFISGGRSALDLQRHLKVTVDGKALSLPSLQGIVFLNIPSWAAGADIWGTTHDEVTMWEGGVW